MIEGPDARGMYRSSWYRDRLYLMRRKKLIQGLYFKVTLGVSPGFFSFELEF